MGRVTTSHVANGGDERGDSFGLTLEALAYVGHIKDVHLSWIKPDAIRGDHYHMKRKEVLLVIYRGQWTFFWDEGQHSPTFSTEIEGSGAIAISIDPGCAHAIRNTGSVDLLVVGLSSEAYDPNETVRRLVSARCA